MSTVYEFLITGKTQEKEKVLEICRLFDEFKISYDCSWQENNLPETNQNPTRNPQEELILSFCEKPRSLKEIVAHCGYKDIRNFREQYITPLIIEKKLQMTIPNQPQNRNQKYIDISKRFYIKEGEK